MSDPFDIPATLAEGNLAWVALYLMRRYYGGPEEGGWWENQGTLVLSTEEYDQLGGGPTGFTSFNAAYAYAEKLETNLAGLNKDRRTLDSVLSSEGVYEVVVAEAPTPPQRYPKQRSTYE